MFDSGRYDCCLRLIDAWADLCGHEGMGQFLFSFLCCWQGINREREGEKGGLGWTYGVVDYSFDGDENPERRRHDEDVRSSY